MLIRYLLNLSEFNLVKKTFSQVYCQNIFHYQLSQHISQNPFLFGATPSFQSSLSICFSLLQAVSVLPGASNFCSFSVLLLFLALSETKVSLLFSSFCATLSTLILFLLCDIGRVNFLFESRYVFLYYHNTSFN